MKDEKSHRSERRYLLMERRNVLWIVIAILFLAVLFLTFKVGAGTSANAVTNTASTVQSAASSGSMVGGC